MPGPCKLRGVLIAVRDTNALTVDESDIMDLTTIVTACALAVDPKIMHALIWHQSSAEPWSFTVAGVHRPQVFRDLSNARRCRTRHLPGRRNHSDRADRPVGHSAVGRRSDVRPLLEHHHRGAPDRATR